MSRNLSFNREESCYNHGMKTIAIIAEYNPFHSGHALQINKARQMLGNDCAVITAMSGPFTQRGEPALLDKWTRTFAALSCGVDLVLELPFAYATASAEKFASGGVQLLAATGLQANLVFGSEAGDLAPLQKLATLFNYEPDTYKSKLKTILDHGHGFAAARQQATADYLGDDALASLLKHSNNILAVEYLKALAKLPHKKLKPLTIQRTGQAYRDQNWEQTGQQASATAIRQIAAEMADCLFRASSTAGSDSTQFAGYLDELRRHMPAASLALMLSSLQNGPGLLFPESLAPGILGLMRATPESELAKIRGMSEGLSQRFKKSAARPDQLLDSQRLQTLIRQTGSKRFPQTRVCRAATAALAGLTVEDDLLFDQAGGPQYIRVLGFSKKGRHLLKLMRKLASLPIIMNASDFLEYGQNNALQRMAELDLIATDIWSLYTGGTCGRDFEQPPIQIR